MDKKRFKYIILGIIMISLSVLGGYFGATVSNLQAIAREESYIAQNSRVQIQNVTREQVDAYSSNSNDNTVISGFTRKGIRKEVDDTDTVAKKGSRTAF